jgi:hypothetical protein
MTTLRIYSHYLCLASTLIFAALSIANAEDVKPDTVAKNTPAPVGTDQQDKRGSGRFISFKDGTLTLKGNFGILIWNNVPAAINAFLWDTAANGYKPAGNSEILSKVEVGTFVMISDGKSVVRIGSRKDKTTGTFISFKDNRLLLLGKDLGESYTKKYGNQLHFNRFADDVPVYESIDGGEYKLVGGPAKTLPTVKEGTILFIYGEGDDNITRIEIGVQKKN